MNTCLFCDEIARGKAFDELYKDADEALAYVKQNPPLGFCVNWARVRIEEVLRVCDSSGTQSWQVLIAGAQDNKLEILIDKRLDEKYGDVEVRSEW